MSVLMPGDPCPCCGRPIKSHDPDVLRLLNWVSSHRRMPTMDEIEQVLDIPAPATEE
ncbi:MAG: hypothetical protein VB023_09655 [Oscillibacter sp.]|nr:hypothetical protein [Oscillibacter sp.]